MPYSALNPVTACLIARNRSRMRAPPRPELDAVAPRGTLLIASHDPADLSPRHEHGFDPSDYYQPADIARLLDHNWTVLINETRPRTAPTPAGTHHTHDTVLRAHRLP